MPIFAQLRGTTSNVPPSGGGGGGGDYAQALTLTLAVQTPGINAAPTAMWFECTAVSGSTAQPPASGVYDPTYHEITYVWDFDDAANATPTPAMNMPGEWEDTNTAYGKRVAHPYNDPGTYTVTCYAYEPATRRFGSQTIQVTVNDADTVFPGNQTIIYDPDGDADLSAYPTATVRTTWPAVRTAAAALGATPRRILIAPGKTLVMNAAVGLTSVGTWANFRVGALDPSGSRSTFEARGLQGAGQNDGIFKDKDDVCVESVFYDVNFVGEWDSTIENGKLLRPIYIEKDGMDGDHLYMLHRCDYGGFETLRPSVSTRAGRSSFFMLSNSLVTNWQNYGVFCGNTTDRGSETAFVGTVIAQHPDALSGGAKIGLFGNHGCVRDVGSRNLFMSVCDLFSRTGWSPGGTWNYLGAGLSRTTPNAALRVNTFGGAGCSSNLDRMSVEGYIWMKEQDSQGTDREGNHLVDKVLQFLGGDYTLGDQAEFLHGGVTVRNYLSIRLDQPKASTFNGMTRFFGFFSTGANGGAANAAAGARLYNSTGVDLRTNVNAEDATITLFGNSGFTTFVTDNNILHQPNRSPAISPDGPIDVTTAIPGVTPRNRGPRFGFQHQEGTLPASVPSGGSFTVPYSQITDQLSNSEQVDNGTPTTQSYWTALTENAHRIQIGGSEGVMYFAVDGQMSVAFGPAGATITNTSGTAWTGLWRLQLDRRSLLPAWFPEYDARNLIVPTCGLLVGSAAIGSGDTGLYAYDDLALQARPAASRDRGAREAA